MWCPYAAQCPAFWEACDPSWDPEVTAARGLAESVSSSPLGGVTFTLQAIAGTVDGQVTVRNVDAETHPAIAAAKLGDEISVVGLRASLTDAAYTLRPGGRLRVTGSA